MHNFRNWYMICELVFIVVLLGGVLYLTEKARDK